MESTSALEQYFKHLPKGDGLGSSLFVSVGSSITSSSNDLDV
jgi:hypothetical protein